MAKYKIVAESMTVVKNQGATEGMLELRALFTAKNIPAWYPSPSSYVSLREGQAVQMNVEIVTVENLTSVPITAKLWELEPGGGQGDTDESIICEGNLNVSQGVAVMNVDIPGNNWKESTGKVAITFRAVLVDVDPGGTGKYKITAETMGIIRDQRTGSGANWEGTLELKAQFTANNNAVLFPSIIYANQGDIKSLSTLITIVENIVMVPIKAELWELEPGGGQGQTDFGSASGLLNVSQGAATLDVTVSADTGRERAAIIQITFKATKLV